MNKKHTTEIDSTIKVRKSEKQFATYQFKIPHELWIQFKVKTITADRGTCADALVELIKKAVRS